MRLRAGRARRSAPTTRHPRQPTSLPYIPAEAGRRLAALAKYGGWTGIAAYIALPQCSRPLLAHKMS